MFIKVSPIFTIRHVWDPSCACSKNLSGVNVHVDLSFLGFREIANVENDFLDETVVQILIVRQSMAVQLEFLRDLLQNSII